MAETRTVDGGVGEVSERTAAKDGVRVGLRRDGGAEIADPGGVIGYHVGKHKRADALEIVVRVRERRWLRSRRIIDADGQACSMAMASALAEAAGFGGKRELDMNVRQKKKEEVILLEDEGHAKKRKIETVEVMKAEEIVDLT